MVGNKNLYMYICWDAYNIYINININIYIGKTVLIYS